MFFQDISATEIVAILTIVLTHVNK